MQRGHLYFKGPHFCVLHKGLQKLLGVRIGEGDIQTLSLGFYGPYHGQRLNESVVSLKLDTNRMGALPGTNLVEPAIQYGFAPVYQENEIAKLLRFVHHMGGKDHE